AGWRRRLRSDIRSSSAIAVFVDRELGSESSDGDPSASLRLSPELRLRMTGCCLQLPPELRLRMTEGSEAGVEAQVHGASTLHESVGVVEAVGARVGQIQHASSQAEPVVQLVRQSRVEERVRIHDNVA